jgi:hypothetical protein
VIPEAPTDGRQVGHRGALELDPHLHSVGVLQLQRAMTKAGGRDVLELGSRQFDKWGRDRGFRQASDSPQLSLPSLPTISDHFVIIRIG